MSFMSLADTLMLLSLMGAIACLIPLTIIDLKHWLLPNTFVFSFACFGIAFQASQHFALVSPLGMLGGMIMGGGLLLVVRFFGNMTYKQETLGLGDVKLMMASGIWLGLEGALNAIIVGAFAGILHGIGLALYKKHKLKQPFSLKKMALPAGPGFIVGIVVIFCFQFAAKLL